MLNSIFSFFGIKATKEEEMEILNINLSFLASSDNQNYHLKAQIYKMFELLGII